MNMRLWTCTDHDGVWPVGVASVVLAKDEDSARALLRVELTKQGLSGDHFTLQPVDIATPKAVVLNNGDY